VVRAFRTRGSHPLAGAVAVPGSTTRQPPRRGVARLGPRKLEGGAEREPAAIADLRAIEPIAARGSRSSSDANAISALCRRLCLCPYFEWRFDFNVHPNAVQAHSQQTSILIAEVRPEDLAIGIPDADIAIGPPPPQSRNRGFAAVRARPLLI
jgi:hypothetical protein